MKKMGMMLAFWGVIGLLLFSTAAFSAYHHEGESDSDKFLSVYPDKKGTKLDHCATCHRGGEYESKGKMTSLGSCQWCHHSYGYDGSGNILDTMNQYGKDFHDYGRNADAVRAIENLDSDGDGFVNIDEIEANRFPGDATDDPSKIQASWRVYTKDQLKALGSHTQFMLMNTSRSGDYYAEFTGVPMEVLLDDAGILPTATGILVYAPDGWSQYHPLDPDPDPELYHVKGAYPEALYWYDVEADQALNLTDGWCDYSAPSCVGRSHGDTIVNKDGLKMILAYFREGLPLNPGVLNVDNKLDGEGPFRVVPPQKNPTPPDQSSKAANQEVKWPYDFNWDHNAGAASRSTTIIKVQPLPAGTTDINLLEAGWSYVDQEKLIIYGAISGTDSNGNGILDSEEGTDGGDDFDKDGTPDFQDSDTARVRQANGKDRITIHTSNGNFVNVQARNADDQTVPQAGKPATMTFPYGTCGFDITGLAPGATVTVSLAFPDAVPDTAEYYKIHPTKGWRKIPFGSNDGDNVITLTLTDGDDLTDADGIINGIIKDPGAVAVPAAVAGGGGGGGGCFIASVAPVSQMSANMLWLAVMALAAVAVPAFVIRRRNDTES